MTATTETTRLVPADLANNNVCQDAAARVRIARRRGVESAIRRAESNLDEWIRYVRASRFGGDTSI